MLYNRLNKQKSTIILKKMKFSLRFLNLSGKNGAMSEKKQRSRKYFAPQNEGKVHVCDFPGCSKKGEYRAPKDKTLKDYYWFCLEHVTEYNAAWNYDGSADEAEDEHLKHKMHFKGFSSKIKYQFGYDFIDELGDGFYFNDQKGRSAFYFNHKDKKNAAVLDISLENISLESLKKQYKKLARKYHPDMNAGDKACEELFKKITTAYHELEKKLK